MSPMSGKYADLHALLNRSRLDRDVVEELEHHFDSLVERYREEGMSEDDASAAALARFGDLDRVRAETTAVDRQSHRRREASEITHDVVRATRLALRRLVRRPEFSVFALLTLSVATAAFAALFTVLDRLVLSPLPYDDSGRLVQLESRVPGVGPEAVWGLSVAGYFDLKDNVPSLETMGAYSVGGSNFVADGVPARVRTASVSASLLRTLRLSPVAGRLISESEDVPGGPAVAMLDHGFWESRFGGHESVVGSTIELNGSRYEIVGVLDEGHGLPDIATDVWIPLRLDPSARPVNAHWVSTIGRLADGPIQTARAEVNARTLGFVDRFPNAYPESFMESTGFRTSITPLKDHVLGDSTRTVWVLFAAAGLLLLIAVANVTNLYIVRTEARRRDFEVHAALGASRRHIVWQSLSETLLLSVAAALVAIPLAHAGIRLLLSTAPPGLPRLAELGLDANMIIFTLLVGLAMGVFLGVVPLLYRSFGAAGGIIGHSGTRTTTSRSGRRARQLMLAAQMAVALVLLAAGGLMLRSLTSMRSLEPGFEDEGVLTFDVFIPWSSYNGWDAVAAFHEEFLGRIEGLPGVERAAATTRLPMIHVGFCSALFFEDRPLAEGDAPPCLPVALASPGFFEAMEIPVDGYSPGWSDVASGSGAVVVTQALADRIWPGESPIDKGIRGNGDAPPYYRVRGVARDFLSDGFDQAPIEAVFFPMKPIEGAPLWSPPNAITVVVKTASENPEALVPGIRTVLRDIDPDVPMSNVGGYRAAIMASPSVSRTSFSLLLLGIAAGLALLLSTLGMYGVVSQLVIERSSEIAVRLALGARLREVISMVMGQSLKVALAGVAVGVIGALAASRALGAVLFGVSPGDPLTYGGAAITLLATVALATYLAARRAGRVDPIETLRSD